jgi:maleate isomerase
MTDNGKRRLGLIVPSTNTVAETDFQRFAPPDVSVHTARMFIEETTADSERRMVTEFLPRAAQDLGSMKPHVVVFSCTSAAAVLGADGEQRLIDDMGGWTGAPVVSTNAAVHKALERVGAERVAVLTPYIPDLTRRICEGIERAGVTVVSSAGMGVVDPFAIADITPEDILSFALEQLPDSGFDCIFASCTNLRAYAARAALSESAGVPVVTSNQAALQAALDVLSQGAMA